MPQTKWHLNHNLNLQVNSSINYKTSVAKKNSGKRRISGCVHMWMTIQENYGYMKLPFSQAQNDMNPPPLVWSQLPSSKTQWERTWPFCHMLHPSCLWKKGSKRPHSFKRIQDNRVEELPPLTGVQLQYLKDSAAPELHDHDELEAHVDMPYRSQKCNAKAATVFFSNKTKSNAPFEVYSRKGSTAKSGTILLRVDAEVMMPVISIWLFPYAFLAVNRNSHSCQF